MTKLTKFNPGPFPITILATIFRIPQTVSVCLKDPNMRIPVCTEEEGTRKRDVPNLGPLRCQTRHKAQEFRHWSFGLQIIEAACFRASLSWNVFHARRGCARVRAPVCSWPHLCPSMHNDHLPSSGHDRENETKQGITLYRPYGLPWSFRSDLGQKGPMIQSPFQN